MSRTPVAPFRALVAIVGCVASAALPASAVAAKKPTPKLTFVQQAGPGAGFTVTALGVKRKSEYGLTMKIGASKAIDVVGMTRAFPAKSTKIKLTPPAAQLGGYAVSQYVLTSAPVGATSVSATLSLTLKVYGKKGIVFRPVVSKKVSMSLVRPTVTIDRVVSAGPRASVQGVTISNFPGGGFRLFARPASGGACPDGSPRVRLLSDSVNGASYTGSSVVLASPCLTAPFVVDLVGDEPELPGLVDTTRQPLATSAPLTLG